MRILFCLFFAFNLNAQVFRAPLYNETAFSSIQSSFLSDDSILIDSLRSRTLLLTSPFKDSINGLPAVKRKKAFKRHIKHLSEEVEEYHYTQLESDSNLIEKLIEIELLNLSYVDRCYQKTISTPSLTSIRALGQTSRKTKRTKLVIAHNTEIPQLKTTPFWSQPEAPIHKNFARLAKAKKVDYKKQMVVVFDDFSLSGSSPKIRALDLDFDNEWSIKWGDEVHSDIISSRVFAAMGYDVDHPYFFDRDHLKLIIDTNSTTKSWNQIVDSLEIIYGIDITPFVFRLGVVDERMIEKDSMLIIFKGMPWVSFVKCSMEARPDRVKRLGSWNSNELGNESRPELKMSFLLHALVGNWDTREENTLITTNHHGNYVYTISGVHSDLGASLGVKRSSIPIDFKVGLVNEFEWDVVKRRGDKIIIKNPINQLIGPFNSIDYNSLVPMAELISTLDSLTLRKCIRKAHLPEPLEELYFHKLASRRKSILNAFEIVDPNPIAFNKKISIEFEGKMYVRKGKLVKDFNPIDHPEGFISTKGRKRNYGH